MRQGLFTFLGYLVISCYLEVTIVKHHILSSQHKKYAQRRKLMLLRRIPWHLYQGLIKYRQWASVPFFFFLLMPYRKNSSHFQMLTMHDCQCAVSMLLFHLVSFKLTSLLQVKRKARLSLLSSPHILSSLILKVGVKTQEFLW